MKKTIVLILVICLLLSTAPLSISGEITLESPSSKELTYASGEYDFDEIYGEALTKAMPKLDRLPIKYDKPEFVPGEIIIKFRDVDVNLSTSPDGFLTTGIASVNMLNMECGVTSAEKTVYSDPGSPLSNAYKFILDDDADVTCIVKKYNNDPYVAYAEPNYIYYLSGFVDENNFAFQKVHTHDDKRRIPDDPYFDMQGGLNQLNDCDIDAPEAWGIETGDPDIVIAILDTGVDYIHPDIADNIWVNPGEDLNNNGVVDPSDFNDIDDDNNGLVDDIRGYDFIGDVAGYDFIRGVATNVSPDNDPMDFYGHGTHCSGIASAVTNNGIGIAGVCWNCKIMPLRIVENSEIDGWIASQAIVYAANEGADIISMSWGGCAASQEMEDVIGYAYNRGTVIIGAAGNDYTSSKSYPAGYNNVIAVSASDSNDKIAFFSDFGSWIDVAAPGVDILSLRAEGTDMYGDGTHIVDGYYYVASGTSMSCPHVAGLAGLILSRARRIDLDLSPLEIKTILRSSTDPVLSNICCGLGRVNAKKAMQKIAAITADLSSNLDDKEAQGTVYITGSADGEDFGEYNLEYGRGIRPTSWIELESSAYPSDNIFFPWDTTKIDDGAITIRLRVTADHNTYEDRTVIVVNNNPDEILYVDDSGGEEFIRIQDAVHDAGRRDTVYVYSGKYFENVVIYRSINLYGEDKNTTVIDGAGSTRIGVNIDNADTLQFTGFTVKRFSGGISTYESTRALISNNIVSDNLYFGITSSSDCATVSNNIIRNTRTPLGNGIMVGWYDYVVSGNTVENNEGNGIDAVVDCGSGKIVDNIVKGNSYNGILISLGAWENCDVSIKDNIASDNSLNGIYLTISSYIPISGNFITGNLRGIRLSSVYRGTIYNNTIENNIEDGILLTTLSDEDLEPYSFLMTLFEEFKSIPGMWFLLRLLGSSFENSIFKNNITQNQRSIFIKNFNCDKNTIYHNNFINNIEKAKDKGTNNKWYNSDLKQGNYWDDYGGFDILPPWGVGDTPYIIPPYSLRNNDNYPLMKPYDGTPVNNQANQIAIQNNPQNSQSQQNALNRDQQSSNTLTLLRMLEQIPNTFPKLN